jgi:hypothetical protein
VKGTKKQGGANDQREQSGGRSNARRYSMLVKLSVSAGRQQSRMNTAEHSEPGAGQEWPPGHPSTRELLPRQTGRRRMPGLSRPKTRQWRAMRVVTIAERQGASTRKNGGDGRRQASGEYGEVVSDERECQNAELTRGPIRMSQMSFVTKAKYQVAETRDDSKCREQCDARIQRTKPLLRKRWNSPDSSPFRGRISRDLFGKGRTLSSCGNDWRDLPPTDLERFPPFRVT